MGKVRCFSKRASQVHMLGLFAEENFKAGVLLGFFTGELLTEEKATERRLHAAKSIVEYSMGDEGTVFIDASRGRACPFQWINSVAGSGLAPNVQSWASACASGRAGR